MWPLVEYRNLSIPSIVEGTLDARDVILRFVSRPPDGDGELTLPLTLAEGRPLQGVALLPSGPRWELIPEAFWLVVTSGAGVVSDPGGDRCNASLMLSRSDCREERRSISIPPKMFLPGQ